MTRRLFGQNHSNLARTGFCPETAVCGASIQSRVGVERQHRQRVGLSTPIGWSSQSSPLSLGFEDSFSRPPAEGAPESSRNPNLRPCKKVSAHSGPEEYFVSFRAGEELSFSIPGLPPRGGLRLACGPTRLKPRFGSWH